MNARSTNEKCLGRAKAQGPMTKAQGKLKTQVGRRRIVSRLRKMRTLKRRERRAPLQCGGPAALRGHGVVASCVVPGLGFEVWVFFGPWSFVIGHFQPVSVGFRRINSDRGA